MAVAREGSDAPQSVLIGCAIAASFWAASGVAAILSPTGDGSDIGSVWFYIIEGTHAVAETGMVIALWGLWKGRAWLVRWTNAAFVVAIGATVLLAVLTYLGVIVTAAGVPREFGEDVVTILFLLSLLGTLIGFIWLGIMMILSRGVHPGVGVLIIAHPLLIAGLLFVYPLGIVIGAVWAAIGWLTTRPRLGGA